MTQAQLGELAGISRSHVANIENERVTNVGVDVINALAAALRVSPQYLLGLTDDPLYDVKEDEGEGSPSFRGQFVLLKPGKREEGGAATDPDLLELLDLVAQMTPDQKRQLVDVARILARPVSPRIIE